MSDSFVTIITIFITAVLIFVLPLIAMAERTDDVTKLSVQTYTTDFVNDIRLTGKITSDNYDKYMENLIGTGNSFDINMELQLLDENPGKKATEAEMTKIGENLYYVLYTSQIEDKLSKDGKITLKEGDRVVVTAKNTNTTVSQTLKKFFYALGNEESVQIDAKYSGIVEVNGADSLYMDVADSLNKDVQGGNNNGQIQVLGPSESKIEIINGAKPNNNGYYNQDVVIKITPGERRQSEIKNTVYSLSGAITQTEKVITGESETITISANGDTIIYAVTSDVNGNSTPSRFWVKIDKSIPVAPKLEILDKLEANTMYYKTAVRVRVSMPYGTQNVNKIVYYTQGAINNQEEKTIEDGGIITIDKDGITKITSYAYNNAGTKSEEATVQVPIDRQSPTMVANLSADNGISSGFNLKVEVIDVTSGLDKIVWYYKKDEQQEYTKVSTMYEGETKQTVKTKAITNLSLGNYVAYAEIYDKANNMTKTNTVSITAGSVEMATDAKLEPNYWTNANVKVTLPTKSGYTTQYQLGSYVDENKTWSKYTSNIEISSNTKMFYRYTDGTNSSQYTTLNINNIDKVAPQIIQQMSMQEVTTTSIKVNLVLKDELSGLARIIWYYKKEGASKYDKIIDDYAKINGNDTGTRSQTERQEEFTGLTKGTYRIYAEIYDVAGNKTVTDEVQITTSTLPKIEIAKVSPTYWTNQDVKVVIPTNSKYTTQYQIGNKVQLNGIWSTYNNELSISSNTNLYYRYADGKNVGDYRSIVINNIDKVAPITSGIEATNITTKSFTLSLSVQDTLSGLDRVEWYYKLNSNKDYICLLSENGRESTKVVLHSINLMDLVAGTYNIYAKIYDMAGNMIETNTIDVTTKKIEAISGAVVKPTYWTNDKVNVELPKKEGFITQYQISKVIDSYIWWSTYENPITIEKNDVVYYRYADGLNGGDYAVCNITNIDKEAPEIKNQISSRNITTRGFTLDIRVSDNASGIGKIIWYYKLEKESTYKTQEVKYQNINGSIAGDSLATKTVVIDGIKSGKYDVYAVVYDVAGNTKQSNSIKVTTSNVANIGTATINPTSWTNGNVTVTLPESSNFSIQYQAANTVNLNGTWNTYNSTNKVIVQNNTNVYYRYTDGINAGPYNYIQITNIDKTKTLVEQDIYSTDVTTKSFTLNIKVIDTQSGLNRIEWYYKKSGTSTYNKQVTTCSGETTSTIKGININSLKSGTYDVYAQIYDIAGNVQTTGLKSISTGTIERAEGASISPSGWTNGNVKVTLPTKSQYTTEYSTDNGSSWTNYNSPITVKNNCVITYRYKDGVNTQAIGNGYATININNIERVSPTIVTQITKTKLTGTSFTVNITVKDTTSGLSKIEWHYYTSTLPDSSETDTYTILNGSSKGETTNQTKSHTFSNIQSGAVYYVYAIIYDVAGNQVTASQVSIQTDNSADKSATISISGSTKVTSLPVSLNANVTVDDSLSGVNIGECKWHIDKKSSIGTNPSSYKNNLDSNGTQISFDISSSGTWYLHILTIDNAGNAREDVKQIKVVANYHVHKGSSGQNYPNGCYTSKSETNGTCPGHDPAPDWHCGGCGTSWNVGYGTCGCGYTGFANNYNFGNPKEYCDGSCNKIVVYNLGCGKTTDKIENYSISW